jgi:fatty-acyl-CoA synthase
MPLTPVGKIFKPALRWDAVKRVYDAELKALGDMVDSIDVKVAEDKIHGSLATLTIKSASGISEKEIKDRVNEILARYTVQYRLAIKM